MASNKETQYSLFSGDIYTFNLIVGIGVLSMPKAFGEAGLGLGTIMLLIFCFLSFVAATWLVEALASANAILSWQEELVTSGSSASNLLTINGQPNYSSSDSIDHHSSSSSSFSSSS